MLLKCILSKVYIKIYTINNLNKSPMGFVQNNNTFIPCTLILSEAEWDTKVFSMN